jgi:hypothetical protein
VGRPDSPLADRAKVDLQDKVAHAQAAQERPGQVNRDGVIPHSNVLPARRDLQRAANNGDPATNNGDRAANNGDWAANNGDPATNNGDRATINGDRATRGRPISNLAIFSECHEMVTLVGEVPSLIAGSSNRAFRGPESRAKPTALPNDAIASPTGDRSRSRIEQSGSTTAETLCAIKRVAVTFFRTNGEGDTLTRPTTDGHTRPDGRRITGGVAAPGPV